MVQGASSTTTEALAEPLFRSADGALKFAFLFSSQQYPLTIMAKMMRGCLGSGKGLVGIDGAAQAGMVLQMVDRLRPSYRAAIHCRYSDQTMKRFDEGIDRLARDTMQAISGVSHLHLRKAIIARHFGVKGCVQDVADKCGVHRNTVRNHERAMKDLLKQFEDRAYQLLADEMMSRGLVGDIA